MAVMALAVLQIAGVVKIVFSGRDSHLKSLQIPIQNAAEIAKAAIQPHAKGLQ
jgi:hypothetical protein